MLEFPTSSRRVAIIGGGITGLSAAFYIRKQYREIGINPHITVVDKRPNVGGMIETTYRDGFIIEKGPDSFLARKREMIELADELKMTNQLVSQRPINQAVHVMHKGKLISMPKGLVLGIPTKIVPFLFTPLVSPLGKLRALLDICIPPSHCAGEDESVGFMMERRLGKQMLCTLVEPLLAGIYAGNLYDLSLQATFPQFIEMEQTSGGLIRGMKKKQKEAKRVLNKQQSTFLSFRNGFKSVVQALVQELHGVEYRLKATATSILPQYEKEKVFYRIVLQDQTQLEADDVIVTIPTYAAANLFRPYVDVQALEAIHYVSVANVVVAFQKSQLIHPLNGSGFLVPPAEGLTITACTWTSSKWEHTSPTDKCLLRCYVGRLGEEDSTKLDDDTLIKLVLEDLHTTMGIDAPPLFTEVTRWPKSMPQYPIGHLQHIQQLRQQLAHCLPHVHVCGAGYEGVGLPDCIKQAKQMATQATQSLLHHL